MANDEKTKVSVNKETKREIDIIAASEQRPVYVVVDEMVEIYKATKTGKKARVDVSEMVKKTDPKARQSAPVAV